MASALSLAMSTAAIAIPDPTTDPYSIGNAKKDVVRGPRIENADLALLGREGSQTMQFRLEAYSVFNHTQLRRVNTSALFNPTTSAQNNEAFGSYT
ncbi:MAG: hypothetical protein ABI380_07765 [Edaphobacter sp.]